MLYISFASFAIFLIRYCLVLIDDTALFVQGKDVGWVYNDMKKKFDTTERMVLLQQTDA